MAKQVTIAVNGIHYLCNLCYGAEYGKAKSGFPFQPYKIEKILDIEYAYLVDAKGIIWVVMDGIFTRPCLFYCINYILIRDPEFKNKKPSDVLEALEMSHTSQLAQSFNQDWAKISEQGK